MTPRDDVGWQRHPLGRQMMQINSVHFILCIDNHANIQRYRPRVRRERRASNSVEGG